MRACGPGKVKFDPVQGHIMKRMAKIKRDTAETQIALTLRIDGSGKSSIATGIPFLDHMLTLLAKHSLCDLTVRAKGDLDVDAHHRSEERRVGKECRSRG